MRSRRSSPPQRGHLTVEGAARSARLISQTSFPAGLLLMIVSSRRRTARALQRVDDVVAAPELGYTSRAEFIKEAVRLRVEAMENLLRERAGRS